MAPGHDRMLADTPELSIVVPVFNEEGNVLPLLDEIETALKGVVRYEIVFVDDGSTDDSPAELEAAAGKSDMVRVLRHDRRAGKSAALVTGFEAARAAWVQTLDGDRQNDPRDVARIWAAIQPIPETLGLVAGQRRRRNDGAVKWLSSRTANLIRRSMLNDATADSGCGFKLIRREAALRMPYFDGMHRFIPALVRRSGFEIRQEAIDDRPRMAGVSKYGFFGRLGVGTVDLFGVFWLMRRSGIFRAKETRTR
jgi:dolichol-phosphate mannosyltransferase